MSHQFKLSNSLSFDPIHLKIEDGKVMWKVGSGTGHMEIKGVSYITTSREWVELFETKDEHE